MAIKLDEARVRLLKITNTDGDRHISFSRSSYNYIGAPSNGVIGLLANDTLSAANCAMVIATSSAYPGTTNAVNLGTSSYKWANVYATTFTGDLSGTASKATTIAVTNTDTNSWYPITFASSTGAGQTLRSTDSAAIYPSTDPEADTEGWMYLRLGNTSDTSTAGNKSGRIRMYRSGYRADIYLSTLAANRSIILRDYKATGYLIATTTTSAVGSASLPVYVNANGVATAISGVAITSAAGANIAFSEGRTGGSSVAFGVGTGNVNHGVYSNTLGKWIVYADASNVYLNGNATTATTASKTQAALSLNGKSFNGSTAVDMGTLGAAYGGTGQTSLINSANVLLNALSTGSSNPTGDDYYISQYAGGGTTTTTYHRRPVSKLYNYIKSAASGTWGISISGNAASASKLIAYEARATTTDLNKAANYGGAGAIFHLIASSSTTAGKCPTDANILQMNWDNNGGYDSQFAIATGWNRAYFRAMVSQGTAWSELVHIVADTKTGSENVPVYVKSDGSATAVSSNSVIVNLASTSGASIYAAAPRPGITGTLPVANGGTGRTSLVTPTVTWANGTTNGPTLTIKDSLNQSSTAVAIPKATSSQSGIVTTKDQTFGGTKRFAATPIITNATHYASFYLKPTLVTAGEDRLATIYSYGAASSSSTVLTTSQVRIRQYSYTSDSTTVLSYYDQFSLPATAADKTANNSYNILTTKNTITVAQGGTGATSAAGARANLGTLSSVSANGYYGMGAPNGSTDVWIRTTSKGIIPYQSGGASALGTSDWPFTNAYINTVHGNLTGNVTGNVSGSSGSCTGNAATATKLGTSTVGATDRPIYLNSGTATQTTYRMAATNATATTARAITENLETGIWYVSGTSGILSQSDGVAYVNKYNDSWIAEIYQDYRTGQIAVRGKNNGTWQAWRKVLDSTNYSSYALPKTGGTLTGNLSIQKASWGTFAFKNESGNSLAQIAISNSTNAFDGKLTFRCYSNASTFAAATFDNAGVFTASQVKGAVWNDYAEYRESDCKEFGRVLAEKGDDSLTKTTKRLQPFAGVSSDTWGYCQGETEKAKTPIAVAGRVLVYTYRNRKEYKPGDVVCAAPNGTVDIMTREEIIKYPDRIVGTVSCVPEYEIWGSGDRDPVKVGNRIWIKVN